MDTVTPVKAMTKAEFKQRYINDQNRRRKEKKIELSRERTDLCEYIVSQNEKVRRRKRRW